MGIKQIIIGNGITCEVLGDVIKCDVEEKKASPFNRYENLYRDLQEFSESINDAGEFFRSSGVDNYYRDELIKVCRKIVEDAE